MSGEHAHPDLADQGASLHADLVAMAGRVATLEAAQATTDAVCASLLARVATLEAQPPTPPIEPPAPTYGHSGPLTLHEGDITVRTAGTVLDSLDITGRVRIKANNVTVRNCRVSGPNTTLIECWDGTTGLLVEGCTLAPDTPGIGSQGIHGGGYTARRLDVFRVVDGFGAFGQTGKPADVLIEDCWVHDLHCVPDPARSDGIVHADCVQLHGGGNVTIRRNTLTALPGPTSTGDVGTMSAVMVTPSAARGPVPGVLIEGNTIDGGAACLNLNPTGTGDTVSSVTVRGNRFGRSGGYRILAKRSLSLTTEGNTYTDDGTPVPIKLTS